MLQKKFRSNAVVDMVRSTESNEALEETDEEFTQALISLLKHKKIKEVPIGSGGQFSIHELVGNEDVVVKRLRAGKKMDLQGDRSVDEYWTDLQKEHQMVEKFLERFVPYTKFVIVNGTNFEDPHPEDLPALPGREYVMVQEKLSGVKFSRSGNRLIDIPSEMSPKIKPEIIEFIKAYETMLRKEGLIPEDQLMINFLTGDVKISDTNHLQSLRNYVSLGKDFLEVFKIDRYPLK